MRIPPEKTFDQLIDAEQSTLLHIRRRHFALVAVEAELERVSRGKLFAIHNDIVWRMLGDHHHVLVTELASWAKSLLKRGGLFGQLEAHHLRRFPRRRSWGRPNEDGYQREVRDQEHAGARSRLFGNAIGGIKPAIIADLKDRFAKTFDPVSDDRDLRSHSYEDPRAATADSLGVSEVTASIAMAATMLNDLALVGSGSGHEPVDLNVVDSRANAVDLVDQVLVGPSRRHGYVLFQRLGRDEFYDGLHTRHAIAGDVIECFNDPSMISALRGAE